MKSISIDAEKSIRLFILSDIHYGARNCREDLLQKAVKIISQDKESRVILLGDQIDLVGHLDVKRFAASGLKQDMDINDLQNIGIYQVEGLSEILKPIENQIIAAVEGNHEESFKKCHSVDLHALLCQRIGCIKLPYVSHVRLQLMTGNSATMRSTFDIVLHHGNGGSGKTKGYPINICADMAAPFECDLFVMGHIHRMADDSSDRICFDRNRIYRRQKHIAVCGTFLDTALQDGSNYFERKMKNTPSLGFLDIEIQTKRESENGARKLNTSCSVRKIFL